MHDTPAAAARSPLKIVESMAAGVPVVTGNVGDRREIISDAAGLTVPPGDAQALADGIATLLTNPAYRARLAQGARLRAEVYNWNRLASVWQTLYQIGA
ncbi:MAG: glycosyltransferase [Roseiflexaceae bacterium]|nr:glycosyltransferase [Roseiflexaceae bacterium]